MTRQEIRDGVASQLAEILDVKELHLADETRASEVAGWDSFAHLKLLVALEDVFHIKFQLTEMKAAQNVGELVDMIAAKTGSI